LVDYYSLGAVFYEMIFEDPPYYEEDLEIMKHRILNDRLFIPKDKCVSKECKDLIVRLL